MQESSGFSQTCGKNEIPYRFSANEAKASQKFDFLKFG